MVRQRVSEIIDGPGSSGGYRTIWHTLEMEGLRVPRKIVQDILKELDPEGTQLRKAHRLKRRWYVNGDPMTPGIWIAMTNLSHLGLQYMEPLMALAEKFYGLK